MDREKNEKDIWNDVKSLMGEREIRLGEDWSFNIFNDPKRLSFVLSRYKFAAKMVSKNKNILELGCNEGIGAPILSEFASGYTGVDMDCNAVNAARQNWSSDKVMFIEDDFLGKSYGDFEAVVSLDVVEHIAPVNENIFFETIHNNINTEGIVIIGTPNITASSYTSPISQIGHVNLFDSERLRMAMLRFFFNVFVFGINDEVVHTGFLPMAHYLICIGCYKK